MTDTDAPDISFDVVRAAERLERSVPQFLRDLETLTNIDSGTFDKPGADEVGRILRARYTAMRAVLREYPHPSYGDAFSAHFEGRGSGSVLLIGHIDTVYPLGTAQERPFRIEGDRAIGPGTADMKAGDLAIVYALDELLRGGWDRFARIEVLHNADEEVGSPASRELVQERAAEADAVLVLEPGRESGAVVSARKGIVDARVQVTGRAAHAGVNHNLGRNAALELAHIVIGLEGLNGQWPDVTVNVGRIEGGERSNVVPERASAHVEMRAFQESHLTEAVELIREIVARRTVADTRAHVDITFHHRPMERTEGTARLFEIARSIAAQLGFTLEETATGGASDGNTASAAGRPVLDALGPIGGGAHSPLEYVLIPSIAPRIALLAGLIAAICGSS